MVERRYASLIANASDVIMIVAVDGTLHFASPASKRTLGLNPEDYTDKKAVVAILLEHPELMQRPIVIRGKRAIIARPPEKLEALL